MDAGTAFKPVGPTVAILGSFAVSPPGTLIGLTGDWALLVFNRSTTIDGYLAYGPSSAAVTGAVIPAVSTPAPAPVAGGANIQNVLPLPRGTIQTFTFSGPTYIGAITGSGNTTIDITPGVLGGV